MSAALPAPGPWSNRRLMTMILLIFLIQLILIFWLSDRTPPTRRLPAKAPSLALLPQRAAPFLALDDPTLFAIPSPESFSGLAWLKSPQTYYHPFVWTNAYQFLSLSSGQLGAAFHEFIGSNNVAQAPWASWSEPMLSVPIDAGIEGAPLQSTLRLTGGLRNRQMLEQPVLTNFAFGELLTNSIVRLVISRDGRPVSLTLVVKSQLTAANQLALDLARKVRFAPLDGPADTGHEHGVESLTWGAMIFDWATLPLSATNSAGAASL